MRSKADPVIVRLVLALVAVPATALVLMQLPRLRDWVDERRLINYTRRVQPQLAADPRFKFIQLHGSRVSGFVSNSDVFMSLNELIAASKPPLPISLRMVETNETDWRIHARAQEGADLMDKADAVLEANWCVRFIRPASTNCVTTLAEFEAALSRVQQRNLAVILIQALGFDGVTNMANEAAATLKQCGFQKVHVAVQGWGMIFPYSEP